MSAGAINNAAAGALQQAGGTNKFAELSSSEFVKVLVKELANQDPFDPQDSSKILEQLSSLRNIESQTQLQDQLKNLVLQNELAQASGLIGKTVQGLDASNNRIDGVVASVRVQEGKAILELDTGKQLPMTRLERITGGERATESALLGGGSV
ncbi:MAG: flagellar hook capping FlgD N-terminal domain-containing protein [Phycisphaeraceae bacterium]